jgi:glycosyltransferase involved in cell wall biosynthesis
MVIAEGLSAGRAVIVSAAGGATELVTNDVDALTHAPGDAAGLADCIARLAVDPGLRARLGAAGRRAALRKFDPTTFTTAFAGVYRQAQGRMRAHVGG